MGVLSGKVAIITGSSRGIGKSLAVKMAHEGASVVVNGRDQQKVGEVVEEIRQQGGKAVAAIGSIASVQGAESVVETALQQFRRLDILVNNAGVTRDRISFRMTEKEWDDVLSVHLKGAFLCSREAALAMKSQGEGGVILSMTSLAGLQGCVGQVNYAAAKAGLLGLTWTLAMELQRNHIRVNAIAPAALTDMTRPLVAQAKKAAEDKGEPFPDYWKIGEAEDVAPLAVFLASNQADEITGEIFSINGGRLGKWRGPQHEIVAEREASWTHQEIAELLSS